MNPIKTIVISGTHWLSHIAANIFKMAIRVAAMEEVNAIRTQELEAHARGLQVTLESLALAKKYEAAEADQHAVEAIRLYREAVVKTSTNARELTGVGAAPAEVRERLDAPFERRGSSETCYDENGPAPTPTMAILPPATTNSSEALSALAPAPVKRKRGRPRKEQSRDAAAPSVPPLGTVAREAAPGPPTPMSPISVVRGPTTNLPNPNPPPPMPLPPDPRRDGAG